MFQTCILKTVFKETEDDKNTFFFPHDAPEQEAALEGPLFICSYLQVSSSLVRESSRHESMRQPPGQSGRLLGRVSWGWLWNRASPCHLGRADWWHSKRCSSLPPSWPRPPSLSYLVLHRRRNGLYFLQKRRLRILGDTCRV